MNNKIKWLIISLALVSIISLFISISTYTKQVKLAQQLDNMEMGGVVYNEGYEQEPSIFADYDHGFADGETISYEEGTIDYYVSLTPVESTANTTARVKINGESFNLERQDNKFVGTAKVSIFEPVDMEAILEGDGSVRTELFSEESPFVDAGFAWYSGGGTITTRNKSLLVDWTIGYDYGEYGSETPEKAKIVVTVDGTEVYKKNVKTTLDNADNGSLIWKDTVSFDIKKAAEVYVITKDVYGLIYEFHLGTIDAGSSYIDDTDTWMQVKNKDGKVLYE